MLIILLLFLAHLITDFWLQFESLARKNKQQFIWYMFHVLLTNMFVLLIIWGIFYQFVNPINHFLLPILLIVIMYFIIDVCTSKFLYSEKTISIRKTLVAFSLKQVSHLTTILIVCLLFFHMTPTTIANSVKQLFIKGNGIINFDVPTIVILILIIIILATSVSGQFIKLLVGSLPSDFANFEGAFTLNHKAEIKPENFTRHESLYSEQYHYLTYSHPAPSRGKMIGYIERLLVILLTITGAYSAIAFIVAAKSIARFKQLDDRNWAEYFLLGTLTSILIGLSLGLLAQRIFL